MKTWKKAGLTALAGSLVATSAFAGAMTVSGTANLSHTLVNYWNRRLIKCYDTDGSWLMTC